MRVHVCAYVCSIAALGAVCAYASLLQVLCGHMCARAGLCLRERPSDFCSALLDVLLSGFKTDVRRPTQLGSVDKESRAV